MAKSKGSPRADMVDREREKEIDAALDLLVADVTDGGTITGGDEVISRLTRRVVQKLLGSELTDHLGYERGDRAGYGSGNSRNGTYPKTAKTTNGEITLDHPRDRNGTFEPQILAKGDTCLDGLDERIISMYARGMTVRDIQAHLADVYGGLDVSPQFISDTTAAVLDDAKAWQQRPLSAVYPIVWLDALNVSIRDSGVVRKKAVYVALGLTPYGYKETLGMWLAPEGENIAGKDESATFWQVVLTELQNRGVRDMLVCCVDGLTGFPEAIEAIFPDTWVQSCVVHMIRNTMRYVAYKDRQALARDLRPVYTAPSQEAAEDALDSFEAAWGDRYPVVPKLWRDRWALIVPMFAFPAEIRKIMYTTNIIESLNSQLRKTTRNRGLFPNDDSAKKLLYLVLMNAERNWTMPVQNWALALNQFEILFPGRLDN